MFGLSDLLSSPAQVTVSPASASKANLLHIILFLLFVANSSMRKLRLLFVWNTTVVVINLNNP